MATLLILAPAASAATATFTYAENGTDPVARFSASDEDGDEVTWGLEGDDAGDFKISDAGVLTFKEKPNYEGAADKDEDNVYKVTVTATAKSKSTQDVEVTVTDVDEAGKVTLSQPQPQVSRGLEADGPGDPDDPVEDEKWQWSRGPNIDGPWTEIAKATAPSRPPVEADVDSYLLATVTYTDKFGAGKTASLVSENPVEARTVANAAPSFSDHDTDDTTDAVQAARAVDEGKKGANVGKPLSAKDADGDVLLYTIAAAGSMGDTPVTNIRDLFSIDPRSGQLKTKVDTLNSDDSGTTADSDPADPDGEVTYTITVTAKDPSGAPGMATVTVTITDVNDKPAFPDASLETHEIEEAVTALTLGIAYEATDADTGDATADAPLTYGVTGADASAFTIGNDEDLDDDGTADDDNESLGQLALKKTPNFETKSSYSVTVTATDDENATAELKVTVTVTNAEDDGEVGLTQREPQIGRMVVASLSDEDGSISGAKWQWFRNATDGTTAAALTTAAGDDVCADGATALCRIDKATGPSYTPVAADDADDADDNAARLAVRVTYTDKHVTDEGNDGVDDGDSEITITQADVQESDPANTAPKFADDQDPNTSGNQADAVRSVAENAKDESVGDAVTATDADGDLMIYTLDGADAMYFTIVNGLKDGGSGEGQINTAMELDYETKKEYMVVVTATDPSGATDTVNVMINVTDADDPPTITGDKTFTVPENSTDPVVTFSASDAEDDEVTWGLEGDDAGDFKISDAGVLTFKDKPNYEGAADKDEDNVYKVTVTATGETKNTQDVEVTVTDVDEAGKVTLSQPQPQVGRTITAEGSGDPDAGVEDEKWQWSRSESAEGPWSDIAKATSTSRTPDAADEGMYLRATVTYTDKFGAQNASMVSENPVEERTLANAAPSFADHDTEDTTDGVQATRAVDEGAKGVNVGKPLSAKDADGDVLLYTIAADGTMDDGEGTDDNPVTNIRDLFSIDPRSGQLKTKVDTLDSDDSGNTADSDQADTSGEASYTFEVTAKDPSGAPGMATVTVTITDVNDKPAFPDASLETHTIEEAVTALTLGIAYEATDADVGDATADAPLTYGVTGADADSFTIGNESADRGQLALKKTPNFETKSSYSVTVTATDDENATAELKVTVTVTNAEDEGEVGLTQREPQVDRSVVASLSDEDGNISGAKWQWFRNATTDTDEDDFTPLPAPCTDATGPTTLCRIDKAVGPSYTPVAADAAADDSDTAAKLVARVTYTDKHVTDEDDDGVDDGDSDIAITQADVQISDPANSAPKFADDQDPNTSGNQADAVRSVPENEKGASVGDAVTATDADGDLMIYTLDGADAMYFTIGSGLKTSEAEGQIKTAMELDYETKKEYMVVVTATDPSGAFDTINVMINVTDADDPPTITPNRAPMFDAETVELTVDENTGTGMPVGDPVMATDADEDDLAYSLGGDDAMYFSIDDMGQIAVGEGTMLDYESDKTMYMVTVMADDGTGADNATASIAVTIMVTNVNDVAPMFDAEAVELAVAETAAAGVPVGDPVVATDAEGDDLAYSLGGDDAMYFAIDDMGQIAVGEGTMLDYESDKTMYMVTVTASDGEHDASIMVTINVENAYAGCDTAGNVGLVNDCEALLASKDTLGGSLDWTADNPITSWEGVTVSGDPMRVTGVWLRGKSLDGTIPAALSRLDMLTVLNLHSNMLSGEIPDLGGTALQELYLSNNELEGSVPAWLNMMSDMTELWLTGNSLSGAMPDLSDMTSLERLKVNGNSVSGLDAAMLPGGLRWLIAGETDMGATAPDLSSLMNITTLWMNKNGLEGQIPVASIPTSVSVLNLRDNSLSGTIPDMSGLDNLQYLYLNSNSLSGEIPGTMGDMASIERIWLHENDLMGISAGLDNASDTLTHLELRGNDFAEGTCLPGDLAMVENNDFEMAGLAACGDGS